MDLYCVFGSFISIFVWIQTSKATREEAKMDLVLLFFPLFLFVVDHYSNYYCNYCFLLLFIIIVIICYNPL